MRFSGYGDGGSLKPSYRLRRCAGRFIEKVHPRSSLFPLSYGSLDLRAAGRGVGLMGLRRGNGPDGLPPSMQRLLGGRRRLFAVQRRLFGSILSLHVVRRRCSIKKRHRSGAKSCCRGRRSRCSTPKRRSSTRKRRGRSAKRHGSHPKSRCGAVVPAKPESGDGWPQKNAEAAKIEAGNDPLARIQGEHGETLFCDFLRLSHCRF